jgi:hypothetical protein
MEINLPNKTIELNDAKVHTIMDGLDELIIAIDSMTSNEKDMRVYDDKGKLNKYGKQCEDKKQNAIELHNQLYDYISIPR